MAAASRSTVWRTRGSGARARSSACGASPRPVTPARRSGLPCTSPRARRRGGTHGHRGARARLGRRRAAAGCGRRRGLRGARCVGGRRSPTRSPPTRSSPGSRAARSTGPRAPGPPVAARRPRHPANLGEAQRHQGARAVPAGRADGAGRAARRDLRRRPIPSPYMLFTHGVAPGWAERIPAVVHVDGTARIQTVDRDASRSWRGCSSASRRAPACRSSSTRASTRRAARWSTTRATRSSASAPRPSTCSPSARSWCGAPAWRGAGGGGRRA
jgi:hypothetical protein